jgi:aryl-alcohol dehydrogenase-like predicted oxidoreductase
MPQIARRPLGKTGLQVTVLGYGAMELRGPGAAIRNGKPITPEQADRVLNTVLDGGINFIDTSIDYGLSEESIGRAIAHRRGEYYLASKCGCNLDPSGPRHVFTRKNITEGVEQSLKRMRTDHLDLLQFHGLPPPELKDEALSTLQDLRRQGKARFIGASATLPDIASYIQAGVLDSFQMPYSAIEREHEGAISLAARAGKGTVIRNGVGRGEPGHGLAEPDRWKLYERARLAELHQGMSTFEFMLRFTISHPDLSTTIVGSLNPDHVTANIAAAARGPLPPDVYREAKRRLDALAAPPPQAGQEPRQRAAGA